MLNSFSIEVHNKCTTGYQYHVSCLSVFVVALTTKRLQSQLYD